MFVIPSYSKMPDVNGPVKWADLDEQVKKDFTMDDSIPIHHVYANESQFSKNPPVWQKEDIDNTLDGIKNHLPYYDLIPNMRSYHDPRTVMYLIAAIQKYSIKDKDVLVIGSLKPWLEVICLSHNAKSVTTVDFNPPISHHPRIKTISVNELNPDIKYDIVLSFSSLEHDGLGRYGDPMHPDGDIERMKVIATLLNPISGLMFLGVPMGPDYMVYNIHRIYGRKRFPLLTQDFTIMDVFHNMSLEEIYDNKHCDIIAPSHPWIILRPNNENHNLANQISNLNGYKTHRDAICDKELPSSIL